MKKGTESGLILLLVLLIFVGLAAAVVFGSLGPIAEWLGSFGSQIWSGLSDSITGIFGVGGSGMHLYGFHDILPYVLLIIILFFVFSLQTKYKIYFQN